MGSFTTLDYVRRYLFVIHIESVDFEVNYTDFSRYCY